MARPGAVICELNTRCGPTRRPALLLSCITLPPAFSIRLASCHARFTQSDAVLAGLHPLAACLLYPPGLPPGRLCTISWCNMIQDTQALHGLSCGPSKPAIVRQGEVLAEAYAQNHMPCCSKLKCSTDTLNRWICVTQSIL